MAPARLAAGFDAGFVRAAVPSFEPGGQLELSPPPRPTAADLVADVEVLWRHAIAPTRPAGDHRWTVAKRWYTATEPQHVWLPSRWSAAR